MKLLATLLTAAGIAALILGILGVLGGCESPAVPAPAPVPAFVPASPSTEPATPPMPLLAVPSLSTPADLYFRNCAEARKAGKAPLRLGGDGYRPGLDLDHDGLACE